MREIDRGLTYEKDVSSFYDIRIMFVRNSHKVNVSLRLTKDGKPKRKYFDMSSDLEELIPLWIKYRGKIISVYHRTKEGKYVNSKEKPFRQINNRGGIEPPEAFKQKIERLVLETYEYYFVD